MASGYKDIVVTSYDILRFAWEESSQDKANNKTIVYWELQLHSSTYGAIYSSALREWYVNVDGKEYGGTVSVAIDNNTVKTLASGKTTIAHNADGSRTFSYSFSQDFQINFNGWVGKKSGSGTGTLTPIPRAAIIVSAPDFHDEATEVTVTYSNPLGNDADNLEICIKDDAGVIVYVPYKTADKNGNSYTFRFTDAERKTLRKAAVKNTHIVRFILRTIIDGVTYTDSMAKTLTIINNKPTLLPTVKDVHIPTLQLTGDDTGGTIVKGYSIVEYAINATAYKEATIVSQSITCGEKRSTSATGELSKVQSNIFTFTCIDSRGNDLSRDIELNMIDYVDLTCNQSVSVPELVGETTAQVNITITGNYFNGGFGASNNQLWLKYKYKANDEDYIDWVTVSATPTFNGNSYKATVTVPNLLYSNAYTFVCRAADMVTIIESTEFTTKLIPVFDWGENDFNFNVPVSIQGNILEDYPIETGTEAMGSNGSWYWEKWKSGKAVCYGQRNFGNMGVSNAWGSWYESAAFTQNFPSGLFAYAPTVSTINIVKASGAGFIAYGFNNDLSTNSTGKFTVCRPVSGNLSQVYLSFYAVGRWK